MEATFDSALFAKNFVKDTRQHFIEEADDWRLRDQMRKAAEATLDAIEKTIADYNGKIPDTLLWCDIEDYDSCIIEWVGDWKRVQFFCEDEPEVVFVDNVEKKLIPNFEFIDLNIDNLDEITKKAIEFLR